MSKARQLPQDSYERIKLRIFFPLIIAMAVLLSAFVLAFSHDQRRKSAQDIDRAALEIQKLLHAEQEQKTAVMIAQLQAVMNNPRLAESLRARDRDSLLKQTSSTYEALSQRLRITHFYYHRPDRVNLLRLHHPDEFGDTIKRFTATEAERTGKITSGIERGPLGTFVLRVVSPWRYEGELLGYVELGVEFEDIVKHLHGLLEADFIVAVDKQFLDHEQWNKALAKSHRQGSWDQFPDAVVMDKTMDLIPPPVATHLLTPQSFSHRTNTVAAWNDRALQMVFLPLEDVSGRKLGQLIVLKDITNSTRAAAQSVRFVILVGLSVSAVLLVLFYVFLGRIERAMAEGTSKLKFEILEHQRTQGQLQQAQEKLEQRVEERTRELQTANQELTAEIAIREQTQTKLQETHRQLIEASRLAGMSEVATGVLHNVGNVLNSVNVSATLISDNIRKSRLTSLGKVASLLSEHADNLDEFFTANPKGNQIPTYLAHLNEQLKKEQELMLQETALLQKNIGHIKDIVTMQQNYARMSGVVEAVNAAELVNDALRMNEGALERHGVRYVCDFPEHLPDLFVDRHKVMQILINLIRNAKYACDEGGASDKELTLRITAEPECIKFLVIDNGVGIPQENLIRIFNHGFTTRKEGHGFGLHSGANAAKELGGSLTAHSDGPGTGATFTLELPLQSLQPQESDSTLARKAKAQPLCTSVYS
jgi:C4-dicarboxylate-specific signal transduction histidine kinase